MKKETKYDEVIQRLKKEYAVLMSKYLSKLHNAYHEDYGLQTSHNDIVERIKLDCMSICSEKLGCIAFDDRTEEEVIKEILEYNYDEADLKHMKEVEGLDLYPILNLLEKYCIKRSSPAWFQFGIHELIQNGNVDPGTVGVNRPQFCLYCGEGIILSVGLNAHTSKHTRRPKN